MSANEHDLRPEGAAVPQEEPPAPHGDEFAESAAAAQEPAPEEADDPDAGSSAAAPTADDVDVPRLLEERAEYLEAYQRTRAEFENYKKRMMARQADEVARAAELLVDKLLPVLDACESAIDHGHADVEPVFAALLGTLEKEGLTRIHPPSGEGFDPTVHEAVVHEPGDGDTVVGDVLRTGYGWKGRLLRPAMVKVRG